MPSRTVAAMTESPRNLRLLREDLALQTAEDVAGTLGAMKGVMMKIGQMASYVDDGLSPAVRHTRRIRSRRALDKAGRGRVQIRRVSQTNQLLRRHRSADSVVVAIVWSSPARFDWQP